MRRILRKVVAGEGDQLGDLSSIADPSIVDESEWTRGGTNEADAGSYV
jgi:acetyl-CoA synthetase